MNTILIVALVISILGMFTTKPVSEWLAPKKEGFSAFLRLPLSMLWLVFGKFFCLIAALVFGLILALVN